MSQERTTQTNLSTKDNLTRFVNFLIVFYQKVVAQPGLAAVSFAAFTSDNKSN